jgi:hypothetical protein
MAYVVEETGLVVPEKPKKIRWVITGEMEYNGLDPEEEQKDFTNKEYDFEDLIGVSDSVVYHFTWV